MVVAGVLGALGGVGGRRPDQVHDPVPPALGAGPRSTTFPVLIVKGSRAGVFIYNGAGQLVESMAFLANVDPLTHSDKPGIVSYAPGIQFAQVQSGSLTIGSLSASTRIIVNSQIAIIDALADSTAPLLSLFGPETTGGPTAGLTLNGTSKDGTKRAQAVIGLGIPASVTSSLLEVQGDVDVSSAGHGLRVKEGANAKQGTATLAAGTVVVANTAVTLNSRIFLGFAAPSANAGALFCTAITASTGFTIQSTNAADTSVVAYEIFEPG